MIGPDLRIADWIIQGYISPRPLKGECLLVLKTCSEDLRRELKEKNKKLSSPFYVFEDEIQPEDIVFWEE